MTANAPRADLAERRAGQQRVKEVVYRSIYRSNTLDINARAQTPMPSRPPHPATFTPMYPPRFRAPTLSGAPQQTREPSKLEATRSFILKATLDSQHPACGPCGAARRAAARRRACAQAARTRWSTLTGRVLRSGAGRQGLYLEEILLYRIFTTGDGSFRANRGCRPSVARIRRRVARSRQALRASRVGIGYGRVSTPADLPQSSTESRSESCAGFL